ncbi:MAG TPA: ABC transporter permease, partial [Syntrophales bacterium]|nr:ABC transporter permease [Syntrophales bacterium]
MEDSATIFKPLEASVREEMRELPFKSASYWQDSWGRLRCSRTAMIGLFTLLFLVVMAIIGPLLTPYTYYENHLELKNHAPCAQFWFGTDELGRDLFTRVWWGARLSLFVGITASLVDLIIGVIFGAAAALLGGKIEETMMRLADILYSIPYLLVVILLMVIMGSGLMTIII